MRVLLGASLSVSDEEEAEDGGLTSPSAAVREVGFGIGGVVRATGSESSESMTGMWSLVSRSCLMFEDDRFWSDCRQLLFIDSKRALQSVGGAGSSTGSCSGRGAHSQVSGPLDG